MGSVRSMITRVKDDKGKLGPRRNLIDPSLRRILVGARCRREEVVQTGVTSR